MSTDNWPFMNGNRRACMGGEKRSYTPKTLRVKTVVVMAGYGVGTKKDQLRSVF